MKSNLIDDRDCGNSPTRLLEQSRDLLLALVACSGTAAVPKLELD